MESKIVLETVPKYLSESIGGNLRNSVILLVVQIKQRLNGLRQA